MTAVDGHEAPGRRAGGSRSTRAGHRPGGRQLSATCVYQQVTGANAGVVYPGYDFGDVDADVFGSGFWDSRSQSLVGELRAFAPDNARLRWTAGGFFFDEDQQVFLGSDDRSGHRLRRRRVQHARREGRLASPVTLDATFDVTAVVPRARRRARHARDQVAQRTASGRCSQSVPERRPMRASAPRASAPRG